MTHRSTDDRDTENRTIFRNLDISQTNVEGKSFLFSPVSGAVNDVFLSVLSPPFLVEIPCIFIPVILVSLMVILLSFCHKVIDLPPDRGI